MSKRLPRKWLRLSAFAVGGSRMGVIEDALNEFVRDKKIDGWRHKYGYYEVLTDRDSKIESEIMAHARRTFVNRYPYFKRYF